MPSDEHKLNTERARGDKARALLDDELLNEAFTELEATYIHAWKSNTDMAGQPLTLGPAGRELLWNAVQVVGKVKGHLQLVVDRGKLAARELDQLHPNKL